MTPPRLLQRGTTLLANLGLPPRRRAVWRSTPHPGQGVDAWITHEFTVRGLAPPHCTPAALARALERERQLTILFQPHVSDDIGVYGLVHRPVTAAPDLYVILFRPTYSLALCWLIQFHELAHILFAHPLAAAPEGSALCGCLITRTEEGVAEAFGVGAMQYSCVDAGAAAVPAVAEEEGRLSAFGQLLRRTQYQP